ncbi:NUDIX hydrolase [Streptomyces toxytricini]|uniref:NUDIX hydrolase n=1 Tax=Streptomyces toxytricini TaxID=67369 RepID=UPI00341A14A2
MSGDHLHATPSAERPRPGAALCGLLGRRVAEAVVADVVAAASVFDDADAVVESAGPGFAVPLAAEVWVFDDTLSRILLVRHRWRVRVPPGGRVEPGETPREAARRELFEETGVRARLLPEPAAATVRSYRAGAPACLGLSYAAVVDGAVPLVAEGGQEVGWVSLRRGWTGWFPEDAARVRRYAGRLRGGVAG